MGRGPINELLREQTSSDETDSCSDTLGTDNGECYQRTDSGPTVNQRTENGSFISYVNSTVARSIEP